MTFHCIITIKSVDETVTYHGAFDDKNSQARYLQIRRKACELLGVTIEKSVVLMYFCEPMNHPEEA